MIRILVPLDGSRLAQQAIFHAAVFAEAFESELHLLQVVEPNDADSGSTFDGLDWELRCSQCRHYLQELQASLAARNIKAHIHVAEGDPPTEINGFCRAHDMNLVAMTAYGVGGITEFHHGSTVQKIISNSEQSLLIIRPETGVTEEAASYQRLLVAMDGSRRSDWAVMLGATLAREMGAVLDLVQIVQEPTIAPGVAASAEGREIISRLVEFCRQDAQRHMEDIRARLPADLQVVMRVRVAQEIPPLLEELVHHDQVDLLVLSAHGTSESGLRPYSPVTENIIAHVSCPVLIFQDAQQRKFHLKPRTGEPIRSDDRPPSQLLRAEAS